MVNNKREDIVKRPARQGPEEVIAEPNRIGASTPCDFEAKNLTATVDCYRWLRCWRS